MSALILYGLTEIYAVKKQTSLRKKNTYNFLAHFKLFKQNAGNLVTNLKIGVLWRVPEGVWISFERANRAQQVSHDGPDFESTETFKKVG